MATGAIGADSVPLRRAGHKELSPFTGGGEGKHILWCSPWAVGHTGGGQISLGVNVAGKISTQCRMHLKRICTNRRVANFMKFTWGKAIPCDVH